MFPFSSCTPNKQKSHLHTFDYIRIKVSLFIFLSPVLQTLTVKQVTAECIWDRKPSKTKPFKPAVGNSYSEYFLLYPYPQKRFIRRLPVLPGKVQHLDHLCPCTKVVYLFLKLRIYLQQMQTSVYASVYAGIYGEKIQIWKEWHFSLHFSSFYRMTLKKKNAIYFFFSQ